MVPPAGERMVRPRRDDARGRLRHRHLGQARPPRPHPLRPGPRSDGCARAPGVPLHRSRRGAARHPALVRPPLVDRGDIRRGPPPPRRRDPTAVSDRAIDRTTPILLGLFSLVTLWADELYATRT